jgi:hypothetical protein
MSEKQNLSGLGESKERQVKFLGGAAIDGAPVAYIIVLAAVVTALSFIPFSIVLGEGGSFPLSQGIYPLVGWILGPIAGAIATGIGQLIGIFVAPHTAGVPVATMAVAIVGGFAAGAMTLGEKRKSWWIWITVAAVICLLLYPVRAIVQNGAQPWPVFISTFINWSSILLFALPTRTWIARLINDKNPGKLALGLFLGTWVIAGLGHLAASVITYFMFNWPSELFVTLMPVIPFQHLIRCLAGAVIGTGVIVGLRAMGLVKPTEGIY